MFTTGQWIREKLIEAGEKGVVIADLHKERKANWKELGLIYKGGTYSSFAKLFNFLWQLGWVERTGETEVSHSKGGSTELFSSRAYYCISGKGLTHLEQDWHDPIAALHPEWSGSLRRQKYYSPTGESRGRPRIGSPKIKKPVSPPRIKEVKVVKKVKEVVLTEGDRARVIKEFLEVMEREPTKKEIYELFLEELKLKRRKIKEEG